MTSAAPVKPGLVRLALIKIGQQFCLHEDQLLKIPPARDRDGGVVSPGELRVRCWVCGRESEGFVVGM